MHVVKTWDYLNKILEESYAVKTFDHVLNLPRGTLHWFVLSINHWTFFKEVLISNKRWDSFRGC